MGNIIEYHQIEDGTAAAFGLLVYTKAIEKITESTSVGRELADGLLSCKPGRRSMKLEQIFNTVLDRYPDDVTIKDLDVMFNPAYKVDILKILISARKRKKYSVIWPGSFQAGRLVYGEDGYPDYKVYKITDYDITFVKLGGSADEVFRTYQL